MLDAEVTEKIKQSVTLSGAGSPFVFTASGNKETLTAFKIDSVDKTIRNTSINPSGLLEIELASFSPGLTATATPGSSLNWDVPATGFSVSVTNPADFPSSYIESVAAIAARNGSSISTTLSEYSAGSKSATPAGGVSWNQAFTTGGSSYIRSNGAGSAGGTAQGRLSFKYNDGTSKDYTADYADFDISWGTPVASISMSALTGKTFLEKYTESSYTPAITNISNVGSNCEYTVSATNATNPGVVTAGAHTLTFSTPLHKTNASSTTTKVSLSAKITRPSSVTGTGYDVTISGGDSATINTSASFTYPSFYTWTAGKATVPTRADIIDGSALDANTTTVTHSNQGKTFAAAVNNTDSNARAFWFAVRASASQPTTFQTGASAIMLSDYSGLVQATVGLAPDAGVKPAGYTDETYNLYGIVLQPGSTYVSIS